MYISSYILDQIEASETDDNRAAELSALLVSSIGTFPPTTMPPAHAPVM